MTVDDWVFEAVESGGEVGVSLRDIQSYIDDHHYEELAIDTLEAALAKLVTTGKVAPHGTRWVVATRTSKADALRRLFGDG